MREEAGQSIKSSVSHTWTLDTRDDRITATRGALLKLQQEYAGLGGDASFFKTQGETQLSRQITPGIVNEYCHISSPSLTDIIHPRLYLSLPVQEFYGVLTALPISLIDSNSVAQ
jgi:hypothetical protein